MLRGRSRFWEVGCGILLVALLGSRRDVGDECEIVQIGMLHVDDV